MRGSQPWRTNRSRALRSRPISAEAKLWRELRNRQLGGFKFVRQVAVGRYYADFLCREQKVIVEVDGGTHGTRSELVRDADRSRDLASHGYRVHNIDVYENMDRVLDALLAFIQRDD